jgi:hypothetical protein
MSRAQRAHREGVIIGPSGLGELWLAWTSRSLFHVGHASACPPGDSPAREQPKAMKLDVRCSSAERCLSLWSCYNPSCQ